MGIPGFFRWLISQNAGSLSSDGFKRVDIIRELTSDSMFEVDNLYLDMNGIFHLCRERQPAEDDIIRASLDYIDILLSICKPKKYLVRNNTIGLLLR
jgi:5'-3' exonuclease